MIIFSNNCITSDNVEIQLFAAASHTDNILKFEIIIQYLDAATALYQKDTPILNMPSREELLYTYNSKIQRAIKTVNVRTLSRLFKFDD